MLRLEVKAPGRLLPIAKGDTVEWRDEQTDKVLVSSYTTGEEIFVKIGDVVLEITVEMAMFRKQPSVVLGTYTLSPE